MTEASTESWTASDLREALWRRLADGEVTAAPEGVSAPNKRAMELLVRLRLHYPDDDPVLPDDIRESEMYRRLVMRLDTDTGYEAVDDGSVSKMRYLAGSPDSGTSATGNELIRKALAREGSHVHFFGPKNSGKTNKAHYFSVDVCGDVFDAVRSNLTALGGGDPYADDEDRIEGQHDTMRGFLKELHTDEQYVCRIIDEVSTAMNGYAFSQSMVETQMSQAINATRKYTEGGASNLITVSHRESLGDVHPVIIENADLVIQTYEGEYQRMTVYKGHFDKQKVDLAEQKITDIYGVPPTTVEHSDSIMAKWWWDGDGYDYRVGLSSLDEPEDEEVDAGETVDAAEERRRALEDAALRLYENDAGTYEKIGEMMADDSAEPIPKQTISDWIRRARDRQDSSE